MKKLREITGGARRLLLETSPSGSFVCIFVLLILVLFLFELPTWLLDVLLASNFLISLTILLRGILVKDILVFFSFPAILVLTTVFRLALNVSSTKLILLHGDEGTNAAGQVIGVFAGLVVGDRFEVGAIIFAIIAIVNFVVITKGSARVAEVAARFNLDALPGRQLSIESELRLGQITKTEAFRRREQLARESQFFGSMDGALKWVQGDAVAAVAICFVNAIGGVLIGLSRGMDFSAAVDTFGRLTIGDGLVTIIPSLLISIAAGVIVTHVSSKDGKGTGEEIINQVFSDYHSLFIAAIALLFFGILGLIFGFNSFAVVAVALVAFIFAGHYSNKKYFSSIQFLDNNSDAIRDGFERKPSESSEMISSELPSLCIEVDSFGLAKYLSDERAGEFYQSLKFERCTQRIRELAYSMRGFVLPQIILRTSDNLSYGQYRILVREQEAKLDTIYSFSDLFVSLPACSLAAFGIEVHRDCLHPIGGHTCAWIEARDSYRTTLERLGVEILSPIEFLINECLGASLSYIDEIFGLDEAKKLLLSLTERHQSLLSEIFDAGRLNYPEFTEILRRLLRERVNIRDLKLILEGVAEFSALSSSSEDRQEWMNELHHFLRLILIRSIVNPAVSSTKHLRALILSNNVETKFRKEVRNWDSARTRFSFEPDFESLLRDNAERIFSSVLERGAIPLFLLCPKDIRFAVQDFFGRKMSYAECIRTLAYEELNGNFNPKIVGVLQA